MKKFLPIIVAGVFGLVIPIAGMSITPIRNVILGLAPDEAVLELAEKIDAQRVAAEQAKAKSDQKTTELQSTVADQQTQLAEQQRMIDEQAKIAAENKKEAECQVIKQKTSWCGEKKYTLSMDAYLKQVKKENPPAMESKEVVAAAKRSWQTCQDFYEEYTAAGCH